MIYLPPLDKGVLIILTHYVQDIQCSIGHWSVPLPSKTLKTVLVTVAIPLNITYVVFKRWLQSTNACEVKCFSLGFCPSVALWNEATVPVGGACWSHWVIISHPSWSLNNTILIVPRFFLKNIPKYILTHILKVSKVIQKGWVIPRGPSTTPCILMAPIFTKKKIFKNSLRCSENIEWSSPNPPGLSTTPSS